MLWRSAAGQALIDQGFDQHQIALRVGGVKCGELNSRPSGMEQIKQKLNQEISITFLTLEYFHSIQTHFGLKSEQKYKIFSIFFWHIPLKKGV